MSDSEVLNIANEISNPHGLKASFIGDENLRSVGVGGDHRTYSRIILLTGRHPGNNSLSEISTKISNLTGINRINIDIPPIKENP